MLQFQAAAQMSTLPLTARSSLVLSRVLNIIDRELTQVHIVPGLFWITTTNLVPEASASTKKCSNFKLLTLQPWSMSACT